jgi:flagellar motor switch protein FliG
MLSPSLRKAAVLIASLDEQSADALLRQMSPDDAAKVRSALVELDEIPAAEQERVLADFLHQQGAPALAVNASDDDVSLDLDPTVEAAAAQVTVPRIPQPPPAETTVAEPPFAFLEKVDAKAIATVLSRELPQTAAVVLGRLPPEKAAAVLQELPAALATDALERIAWLDELSPVVEADLARELRRQLAPHIKAAGADTASLARMTAVLGAMDYRQRQRAVLALGERNTSLLHRLGLFPAGETPDTTDDRVFTMRYRIDTPSAAPHSPHPQKYSPTIPREESAWLTFEDLAQLNDASLRAVLAAADTEVALLALTGAEPRLIARILRRFPAREAGILRQRLEHPGPLRLRDVEQARAALAAVASRLAHDGTIEIPPSLQFVAAI